MSQSEEVQQFAIEAGAASETKTVVTARDFDFVVDEPASLGGTDDGPTPVEYLLGSWAGCLNVVAHLVAEERGIEIDDLNVRIEGDLDPRKLLQDDDAARAGYQDVRVTIAVDTDADEETLEAFGKEVEDRCPVADNIGNATPTTVEFTTN